ncbi:hypothetical protein [Parasphingorhabdus pacifica]
MSTGTNGEGNIVDRAAFRAFVRANHPDVGGDPEVFAAGVAEFRARRARPATSRHRYDRYDAPVVVVRRARGLRAILHHIRLRRVRRIREARVR